jgi:RNA polymerase sigma-70 factor, ECF subfamily
MSIATVPDTATTPSRVDFEAIYREYSPMIYRTAYAVTRNRHDADDVLQSVFLKLIRREYPPDLKANPKAYFHRAAVNLSLDLIKARRRFMTAENVNDLEVAVSPSIVSIDDERHHHLDRALASLDSDAVQILVLRYVHDYSDAEISKLLGRSRGAIALRLFRLRSRLKKLMRRSLGGQA